MVEEISLTKNYRTLCMERKREKKVNIHREEQTGEDRFSIPRYNSTLSTCIQIKQFLCCTFVEISLTKNMERKKDGQVQKRTNRRRLILNPTQQFAIVNMYTKYQVSILNNLEISLTKNYSTEC